MLEASAPIYQSLPACRGAALHGTETLQEKDTQLSFPEKADVLWSESLRQSEMNTIGAFQCFADTTCSDSDTSPTAQQWFYRYEELLRDDPLFADTWLHI